MDLMQSVWDISLRRLNHMSYNLKSLKHKKISYPIDHALSSLIHPCDTLVVSGFWRSGTTWLQQSLAELIKAKTVYEPFHFMVPATKEIYSHNQLSTKDAPFLELYLPYCGNTTLNDYVLHSFFDKALRADIPGSVVRLVRNNVTESFCLRVILKLVRGHLCLRAAQNTFLMPAIHIYRDPRAIVASIKMTDWGWLFEHLSLQEQLLEPKDGRVDFFSNWYDEILQYDKKDKIVRITAYWALTEKFMQHCYADGQARFSFVSYEELALKKEKILLKILNQLRVNHVPDENLRVLDKDSNSTSDQRRGISVDERIFGWKKKLSSSEVDVIESIVYHFGFDDRLVNDL